MAQTARRTNLTNVGHMIRDGEAEPAFVAVASMKNETNNFTIAANESKLVGNTRNSSGDS